MKVTIMDYKKQLYESASILLYTDDYKELYNHIHSLHHLCASITGIAAGNIEDKDIYLKSGKAISPTKAAHCLLEIERTRRFVRGVYKAIIYLKEKFKHERINVLYAGTGPYSALALPITTVFAAEEVGFYLLDINPISIEAIKKLYTELDLMGYVNEFIEEDATLYKIPKGVTMHLIISETMQNALRKEPQVPIMLNLLPQMPSAGVFIPEEITVDARLINIGEEQKSFFEAGKIPQRLLLDKIYTIGKKYQKPKSKTRIKIPGNIDEYTELALFTEIKVFQDEILTAYNSGLNLPVKVITAADCRDTNIEFDYVMGSDPHFQYTIVPA